MSEEVRAKILEGVYRRERERGNPACVAYSYALTSLEWAKVESGETGGVPGDRRIRYADDGLVRLILVPDDEDYDDSYLDGMYASKAREGRARKELWATIARSGVWGLLGQWRAAPGDEWETAFDVWGLIGDFPRVEDCPYARDAQRAVLDALDGHRESEASELAARATYAAGGEVAAP